MEIQTMVQLLSRPGEQKLPRWRFALPLLLQVLLVLAVPMPKVAAYVGGTTAYLEVAPVDPYDPLRGRYIRLDYPLSRPETLRKLDGWSEDFLEHGRTLFVTLVPTGEKQAWKPVAVTEGRRGTSIAPDRPASPPAGAVVLLGRMAGEELQVGLGEYHIPEGVGDEAERLMQQSPGATRAEVRIDQRGNAVLTGLWIGNRRY